MIGCYIVGGTKDPGSQFVGLRLRARACVPPCLHDYCWQAVGE